MSLTEIGGFINNINPVFQFLSSLTWPLLILFIILQFKDKISDVLESSKTRKFTIKVANFELTMDEYINQLKEINKDLQKKVVGGKQKPENLKSLLWIDDNPKNNAMLIQDFKDKKIHVTTALSTEEALSIWKPKEFDAIISDMGRTEEGIWDEEAGIKSAKKFREFDKEIPIFIYSRSQVAKNKIDVAKEAGATEVATSKSAIIQALWNLYNN